MLQSLQFSAVAAGLDPLHKGAKALLNISKKGKMKKYGVFSCIKVIKISFSVIFNEEILLWKGFYQLSIKKASFRGLFPLTPTKCSLDPHRGHCPVDPQGSLPPLTIYPGAAPANTSQKKKGGGVAQVARI